MITYSRRISKNDRLIYMKRK
nr:hypothetical protein [uncultured Alistipes sp.]